VLYKAHVRRKNLRTGTIEYVIEERDVPLFTHLWLELWDTIAPSMYRPRWMWGWLASVEYRAQARIYTIPAREFKLTEEQAYKVFPQLINDPKDL
jgi:hypothetical protein